MKKIHRYILGAIIALSMISTTSAAGPWGFQVSEVNSKINSCAGANVNAVLYISGQNRSDFVWDEFFSKNRQAISDKSTSIRYWQSEDNLLSACTSQSAWQKYSDYSPGNWERVVATGANCTFNKPTNKNNRHLQFVFNIGYYDITGGSWTPNPKFVYADLPQARAGTYSTVNLQNIGIANKKVHSNECLNIELRYCGDGILETSNGEVCDPEDATKRGWGNGGCDTNTCTPITTPACKSLTVNKTTGEAPTDVEATCTGYKVDTFKIDCGNGQVFNGNGSNAGNETFKRTCNYTVAGSFTPKCFINDTITTNSCEKTVSITDPVRPSIVVDKRDANVFDLDGIVGDDTQTVYQGDEAIFKIRVTNNGVEPLKNITLTDAMEASCATKAGEYVDLSAQNFKNINNTNVAISIGGLNANTNDTLEPGEWFEYTCSKNNTQANYTNTIIVNGVGVTSNISVNDDDPTIVLVTPVSDEYDLALRKTLSSTTPGPFNYGSNVTFDITVYNQGSIDSGIIEITDYIPTGLTFVGGNGWTQSGSMITRTASSISAGGSGMVTASFIIDANAPDSITNYAEISKDNGDDCDSIPDSINGNQIGETSVSGMVNDDIGSRCVSGGDEDDHDPETIILGDLLAQCTSLTANPPSARDSLTSTLTCIGDNVTTYKIEVKDASGNVINTINSANGDVTLNSVGNYSASCYINNETTTPSACTIPLSVTSSSSSSSSGGGTPICESATQSGGIVTCGGNRHVDSFYLKCGANIIGPKSSTTVSDQHQATFDCTSDTYQCYVYDRDVNSIGGYAWRTSGQCLVSGSSSSSSSGGSSSSSGGGHCGNGIIEIDKGEQCDMGSAYNGKTDPNGNKYACSSTCQLVGCQALDATGKCVLTWPNGGDMTFNIDAKSIIGHLSDALIPGGNISFTNNSDYDMMYDKLCVIRTDDSAKNGTQQALKSGNTSGEYCANIAGDVIYAYETITLADYGIYPSYTGNKDGISGINYGDTTLKSSIKTNGIDYYNAYFAGQADIRVAKPAVITIGGGASYVKSTTTSDVAEITTGKGGYNNNTNFVGTSVGDGVSSNTQEVTSTEAVDAAIEENNEYKQTVEDVTEVSTPTTSTVTSFTTKYNGLDNVYIVKGKNVELSSLPAITKATTFIVEGGNLIITDDIETDENVAFVVKGGDINIRSNVTKLDGTYISIPVRGTGGNISSQASSDQLVVDGSLYGNINDLVANRYYISDNNSGQLSVGTIVSFGSSLFSKPAPLVSQFVGEYLESKKIAK